MEENPVACDLYELFRSAGPFRVGWLNFIVGLILLLGFLWISVGLPLFLDRGGVGSVKTCFIKAKKNDHEPVLSYKYY